jgi:hypothetical protein
MHWMILTQTVLTPRIQDWLTELGEGTYCPLRCFQVAFFARAPHAPRQSCSIRCVKPFQRAPKS